MSGGGTLPASIPGIPPFGDDPRRGCNGMDTSLFVPDNDPRGRDGWKLAAEACDQCPLSIHQQCRQWAVDHRERGYWGGTTERERRILNTRRRRVGRPAKPAPPPQPSDAAHMVIVTRAGRTPASLTIHGASDAIHLAKLAAERPDTITVSVRNPAGERIAGRDRNGQWWAAA